MECDCSQELLEQYRNAAASASSASCPPLAAAASPEAASAASASTASPSMVHRCLFVYPAESNFDGRIYETTLAKRVKEYNFPSAQSSAPGADSARSQQTARAAQTCSSNPLGLHHRGPSYDWFVCVDASKLLATSTLDLSAAPEVDLWSFYKMFGYPTGLAALVVRNDTAARLWGVGGGGEAASASALTAAPPSLSSLRRFFSGGTVNAVLPTMDFHTLRGESSASSSATSTPLSGSKLHELLEDGTVAFTSILALPYGLQLFARLTTEAIHAHTTNLAEHLFQWMRTRRYEGTQQPIGNFYGAREEQAAADDAAAASSAPGSSSASRRRTPSHSLRSRSQFQFPERFRRCAWIQECGESCRRRSAPVPLRILLQPRRLHGFLPHVGAANQTQLAAGLRCRDDGENLCGLVNGSLRISLGWSSRIEDVQRAQQFVAERIVPMGTAKFITHGTEAADAKEHAVIYQAQANDEPAAPIC